ncbi:uncharacterized protein C6orf47 homolog [Trichomycterus rosablanca]|uniref:uncharacterized protein C6orf47 homolog n=1 Tax=Trichomycterus rosablanca TaxID=2290929 RepID=UPI002F35C5C0
MSAVVGRVWTWVNPRNLYRPWDSKPKCEKPITLEGQEKKSSTWSLGGLAPWVWGPWRNPSDQKMPTEEFWEAQEDILKPVKIEELKAERSDAVAPQRWWSSMLPSFRVWPRSADSSGLRQRGQPSSETDSQDGELSDYGTPPPSPSPLSKGTAAFRFFARSWTGEILPEHFQICFNFIRHLFDLFVVGFLWSVSPPARFVLDVLGVQGALKLWLHGMAMFLVSSVGMAGLLWLVQEYLAQFALVYGIVQALVVSVSVRQSVILGTEEDDEKEDGKEEQDEVDETEEEWEQDQPSRVHNKMMPVS